MSDIGAEYLPSNPTSESVMKEVGVRQFADNE